MPHHIYESGMNAPESHAVNSVYWPQEYQYVVSTAGPSTYDSHHQPALPEAEAPKTLNDIAKMYYGETRTSQKKKRQKMLDCLLKEGPLHSLNVKDGKPLPHQFLAAFHALRPEGCNHSDNKRMGNLMYAILRSQSVGGDYIDKVHKLQRTGWKWPSRKKKAEKKRSNAFTEQQNESVAGPIIAPPRRNEELDTVSEWQGLYDQSEDNHRLAQQDTVTPRHDGQAGHDRQRLLMDNINRFYRTLAHSDARKDLLDELFARGGLLHVVDPGLLSGAEFVDGLFALLPPHRTSQEERNLSRFFTNCVEHKKGEDKKFMDEVTERLRQIRKRGQNTRRRQRLKEASSSANEGAVVPQSYPSDAPSLPLQQNLLTQDPLHVLAEDAWWETCYTD